MNINKNKHSISREDAIITLLFKNMIRKGFTETSVNIFKTTIEKLENEHCNEIQI